MEESEIKNLMDRIPSQKPDKEFVDSLYEKLGTRADEIYLNSQKKGNSLLFPWKMSLAFASFCFILVFSFILFVSPDVKQRLEGYIDQESLAGLSNDIEVSVVGVSVDTAIFVYDNEQVDSPPLNVETIKDDNSTTILLKPGDYRIVVLQEAEIVYEQDIIINQESKPVSIEIE